LTRLERGELNINVPQVSRQIYHLESSANRIAGSIAFAAFLFGGVFLYLGRAVTLGYVFWGFALLSIIWTIFFSRGHSPWR